jgi:hypothetical protein
MKSRNKARKQKEARRSRTPQFSPLRSRADKNRELLFRKIDNNIIKGQNRFISELSEALRDLLSFYDRITGNTRGGDAWTAAEVKRLEEIRKLTKGEK